MTRLQEATLSIVRMIPAGKVMSYGQIAAYLGTPRAARQVGWTMRSLEGTPDFPWWRVLNNSGRITIKGNHLNDAEIQKELLLAEGIVVTEEFTINIAEHRFRPNEHILRTLKLDRAYIENVLAKYDMN